MMIAASAKLSGWRDGQAQQGQGSTPDGARGVLMALTGWFVVEAVLRRERAAEAALKDPGFEAYLPRETKWGRSGRKRYRVYYPLLGRYLFVRVAEEGPDFHQALSADGVAGIVRMAQDYRPIPAKWVEKLQDREARGDFDRTGGAAIAPDLKPGEPVNIIGGHYIGHPAIVVRQEPEERVRVLFEFMRREVEMTLPARQLAAATTPLVDS